MIAARALHHHSAGGAHHVGRRLAENAPAGGGYLRNIDARVHFRKDQELGRIVSIERPIVLGDQQREACAQF